MTGAAVLLALAAASPPQDAAPVFGVAVEVVRVEVLVTRDDEPVRGLSADDFRLWDDGVPQTLHPVTLEKAPVDALLVLDISGSVVGRKLDALREAAGAFLDGLDEGDRAALVGFRQSISVALALTDEISRIRFALDSAQAGGRTALHDAVYVALRLPETGPRRAAVVVFSDGADNVSWLSARQVVAAAGRSNVVVHAVDARGPGDPNHAFLHDVTRATGGQVWRASRVDQLRDRFLDVLGDIRARYLLTYTPEGVDAIGWHELEVRLRDGIDGEVLARPAYYRPGPGATVDPEGVRDSPPSSILKAPTR